MSEKRKPGGQKGHRKVSELYEVILQVLREDSTAGMNAWNVTQWARRKTDMPVNDRTVRKYLVDLVKQKKAKELIVGSHRYYSIVRTVTGKK
jgi:hypothetical protein